MCIAISSGAQKKAPAATSFDFDRLYKEYKDKDSVTIFTSGTSLKAKVEVRYNDQEKPYAVVLYGTYAEAGPVENLIESLGAAKERAGYKRSEGQFVKVNGKPFSSVIAAVFQKGSQYAKYGTTYIHTDILQPRYFYFEVGDTQRMASGQAKPFNF